MSTPIPYHRNGSPAVGSSSLKPNEGKPNAKRRLSDASNGSASTKKSKKPVLGADGNPLDPTDLSNKTKSGRFKPGAPVNLDEQCGVLNEKNLPCSRSLTCKTHGMGNKRSVPGRSKPYDILLSEFQKTKEARLEAKKKADAEKPPPPPPAPAPTQVSIPVPLPMTSTNPTAPLPTTQSTQPIQQQGQTLPNSASAPYTIPPAPSSNPVPSSSIPSSSKPPKSSSNPTTAPSSLPSNPPKAATSTATDGPAPPVPKKKATGERKRATNRTSTKKGTDHILGEVDDLPEADNTIEEEAPDSDDELEQLLAAVGNSRPRPLASQQVPVYARQPQRLARCRETFLTAFTGRSMASSAI